MIFVISVYLSLVWILILFCFCSCRFDNESLTNSGSKYGNDDYAFVDPAKKRIDRLDQAFSPQDGTQSQQNGNPPPQDNVKKEESASVTEVTSVNAKDISIDIDSNK